MKQIIKNLLGSLNNKDEGYSAKKLTAYAVICCIVLAHIKWYKMDGWDQYLVSVLMADFAFVLSLFGINVADKKMNPPDAKEN